MMQRLLTTLALSFTFFGLSSFAEEACTQYEAQITATVATVTSSEDASSCSVTLAFDAQKPGYLYSMNTLCPLLIEEALQSSIEVANSTGLENCGYTTGSLFYGVLVKTSEGRIFLDQ